MQQDGAAGGANAGVYDRDVNGIGGEVAIAHAQHECAQGHVLWRYLVGEVNKAQVGINAQGHAFHDPGVGVGQPEVSGEYQQPRSQPHDYDGYDEKDNGKDYGHLKERFFHAPPGPHG